MGCVIQHLIFVYMNRYQYSGRKLMMFGRSLVLYVLLVYFEYIYFISGRWWIFLWVVDINFVLMTVLFKSRLLCRRKTKSFCCWWYIGVFFLEGRKSFQFTRGLENNVIKIFFALFSQP